MTTNNSNCFGEIFNIGCNGNVTILELFNKIKKILKLEDDIQPNFGDIRKGDIPYSFASIDKAKELLGYRPTVDFDTGLEKLINL